jgi:hypothetical protein
VRDWSDVRDCGHSQARCLQRPDCGFPPLPRPPHENLNRAHPMLHRTTGRALRCHASGVRSGLPRPLKPTRPTGSPRNWIATRVSNRHDSVVKRRLNVSVALGHTLPLTSLLARASTLTVGHTLPNSPAIRASRPGPHDATQGRADGTPAPYFRPAFLRAPTVFLGPRRVRALVRVR